MTREEWGHVCAKIAAWWPHRPWPDAAAAAYFDDLAAVPVDQVTAALQTIYRDGHEFPPNGGMILNRLAELDSDEPSFGDAWRTLLTAVQRFGYPAEEHALDWLHTQHPVLAVWARQIGWHDICAARDGDTTFQAQCRQRWENLIRRASRDRAWTGIEPAGLRRLEPSTSTGPRPLAEILPSTEDEA